MKNMQYVSWVHLGGVSRMVFLFVACAMLTGCSLYHVNSEDTTTEYYPAKESPRDVVFLENIDKPHQVIGIVTVNAERRQYLSEVLEKMKREAAILGGDAITNLQSDASGTWKKLPAQDIIGNGYVRANFTASVVVYK